MSRRDDLLDAALHVLADEGLRGLTHRAVDARAGLPAGSTSNLFRTRRALLHGVSDRLAETDIARWLESPGPDAPPMRSTEELVRLLDAWITRSLTTDRHLTLARYALFLAAASDPVVAGSLTAARERLESWAGGVLAGSGVAPRIPPADLFDVIDGLVLHAVCLPRPDADPRAALRALLAGPEETR